MESFRKEPMFQQLFTWLCYRHEREPTYAAALDAGDFDRAIPMLQAEVRVKNPSAMLIYGTMLLLGQGIDQDALDGLAWIRQAAVLGELRAMMLLGGYLAAGLHVHRSDEEAAYWLWKASVSGLIEAADALSDVVLRSPHVVGLHFSQEDFEALIRVMKPVRQGH